MAEKVFPKGIVCFKKHEKAPDFVVGDMIINISAFKEWINGDGREYLSDYNGEAQLKLQITMNSENRPSVSVNTYKKPE